MGNEANEHYFVQRVRQEARGAVPAEQITRSKMLLSLHMINEMLPAAVNPPCSMQYNTYMASYLGLADDDKNCEEKKKN